MVIDPNMVMDINMVMNTNMVRDINKMMDASLLNMVIKSFDVLMITTVYLLVQNINVGNKLTDKIVVMSLTKNLWITLANTKPTIDVIN
jgi:6-pyruvoyl-tetrahydropterin synthase